jgi:hypothetical protein
VIFVRFAPRLVLAVSAAGMVAASSGAALSMSQPTEAAAVPVPEFASPGQRQEPSPAEQPVANPGRTITGAQIAALALAPARVRAAALIEEQIRASAEAKRVNAERRGDDDDRWEELSDKIREACDDGKLRGPICRSR